MIYLDDYLRSIRTQDFEIVQNELKKKTKPTEETTLSVEQFLKDCKTFQQRLEQCKKTGVYVPFKIGANGQENVPPAVPAFAAPAEVPQARLTRASRATTNRTVLNEIAVPHVDLFKVKLEKLSLAPSEAPPADIEQMPAPKKPAPRIKKVKQEPTERPASTRSTRSRTKRAEEPEQPASKRDSEIVEIKKETIAVIDLDSSQDEEPPKPAPKSTRTKTRKTKKPDDQTSDAEAAQEKPPAATRSTRTKTRAKAKDPDPAPPPEEEPNAGKRARDPAADDATGQNKKKSRSKSPARKEEAADGRTSSQTQYEDAVSSLGESTFVVAPPEQQADSTYVKPPNANETVVVANPKTDAKQQNGADQTVVVANPKVVHKEEVAPEAPKAIAKALFNPLEPSPVKKKVAAFEKYAKSAAPLTRTVKASDIPVPTKSSSSSKMVTPTMPSRMLPKASTGAHSRTVSSTDISGQSASALKASQEQYRERERIRKEEAQKKREALQKRQREDYKKKKEMERLKEERRMQLVQEEQDRMARAREEMERKRQLAKEKAMANKKAKDEEQRRLKAKSDEPVYLVTAAPLLPTEDCYDSDDDRHKRREVKTPAWCSTQALEVQQLLQMALGDKVKNTVFCLEPTTPDLRDIFQNIEQHKLKRTSSAIWRKPPRYTLMPQADQPSFMEDEEDAYDSP